MSLNTLLVIGASGRIFYVSSDNPGRMHDSRIFKESDLYAWLRDREYVPFYDDYGNIAKLIGDSAYPSTDDFLAVPIPKLEAILSVLKKNYNELFVKARNVVERYIGVLKNRFRVLGSYLKFTNILDSINLIKVCCALHNMILMHTTYDPTSDFPPAKGPKYHLPKRVPGLDDVSTDDSETEEVVRYRKGKKTVTTSHKILKQYESYFY